MDQDAAMLWNRTSKEMEQILKKKSSVDKPVESNNNFESKILKKEMPDLTPPRPQKPPSPPSVTMPAIFIAPPQSTSESAHQLPLSSIPRVPKPLPLDIPPELIPKGNSQQTVEKVLLTAAPKRLSAASADSIQNYNSEYTMWQHANKCPAPFVNKITDAILQNVLIDSGREMEQLIEGMCDGVVEREFGGLGGDSHQ